MISIPFSALYEGIKLLARMHFTGLYWFSFMGRFASKYFPVELLMV